MENLQVAAKVYLHEQIIDASNVKGGQIDRFFVTHGQLRPVQCKLGKMGSHKKVLFCKESIT